MSDGISNKSKPFMKSVVITGDSLSVSRYDYDDAPRMNAWDCHIGMGSWSFTLRNTLIASAKQFRYADEVVFQEPTVENGFDPADAVFGDRVRTVAPVDGRVRFTAESDTGVLVFYFQKRPNHYCRFSVMVDGVRAQTTVDTYGDPSRYQGYELLPIEVPCGKGRTMHEVELFGFECADDTPLVTLAGVSGERIEVALTGRGSRTAKFLSYHFEERIAAHSPDTMILIFGGNDMLFYSAEEYRFYLDDLFRKLTDRFPDCRVVAFTIPPTLLLDREIHGKVYTTQREWDENQEQYNRVMREVAAVYGTDLIETASIFEGVPFSQWRYDNVHFTKYGNQLVYEKICAILSVKSRVV